MHPGPHTVRQARFASGLVMMSYMTLHMLNHALGLVSLDAAEGGLRLAVALWQSLPGTVLLYGSAIVHVVLAFVALYDKPSFRLPPIEVVRVVAGFSIPLLLVGHFATTRAAYEATGVVPTYAHVVGNIWAANGQARQLALLAPGWLHGCLGIYIALRHRPWWKHWRAALLVVALALPMAAGLGFIAMVAGVSASAATAQEPAAPSVAQAVRDGLLWIYAIGFASVVGARAMRARKPVK